MRIIILGSKNCPHCRALLKLLSYVKEVSYGYLEFDTFFHKLSEEEKIKLLQSFQASPLSLPLALKQVDGKFEVLKAEQFTKRLLVQHAKQSVKSLQPTR